jgi:hypothetical protein
MAATQREVVDPQQPRPLLPAAWQRVGLRVGQGAQQPQQAVATCRHAPPANRAPARPANATATDTAEATCTPPAAWSARRCSANVRDPQPGLSQKNRRTRRRNATARPAIGASSSPRTPGSSPRWSPIGRHRHISPAIGVHRWSIRALHLAPAHLVGPGKPGRPGRSPPAQDNSNTMRAPADSPDLTRSLRFVLAARGGRAIFTGSSSTVFGPSGEGREWSGNLVGRDARWRAHGERVAVYRPCERGCQALGASGRCRGPGSGVSPTA